MSIDDKYIKSILQKFVIKINNYLQNNREHS